MLQVQFGSSEGKTILSLSVMPRLFQSSNGYLLAMRVQFAVGLFALCAFAQADRLIDIPTARKIPFGKFRYEFRSEPFTGGSNEHYLGLGITTAFELDLRCFQTSGEKQLGTFDGSYAFIAAIPGISPGISLGFQDGLDKTEDGRRIYLATTFREPLQVGNDTIRADVTFGVQTGRFTSPFVGFTLPFGRQLYLVGEHNGARITAGIELRLAQNVVVRYLSRGSQTLITLSASTVF